MGLSSSQGTSSMPNSVVVENLKLGDHVPVLPKKAKLSPSPLPETEETMKLSTAELQRLVLLEQLKLIRMQQQQVVYSFGNNNASAVTFPQPPPPPQKPTDSSKAVFTAVGTLTPDCYPSSENTCFNAAMGSSYRN